MLDSEILSQRPSQAQIEKRIKSTDVGNDVDLLRLVSALLKYTVPEVFLSLPRTCQEVIARVFRTGIGLGNLTARIGMYSRSKTGPQQFISRAVNAHMHLLDLVFMSGLVADAFGSTSSIARKEIEKILFKGQLYSIVREAAANFDELHVPLPFRDMSAYISYLSKELLGIENGSTCSISLLTLGDSASYFDVMFRPENSAYLHQTVSNMKRFERKTVLVKFLEFIALRFFKNTVNPEATVAVSVLSRLILDNTLWDELLLEKVISRYNYQLNSMVALSIDGPSNLVQRSFTMWGSANVLSNEPLVKQGFRTHLLLCLCAQLSVDELQDLLKQSVFVNAITNRLSSLSNQVKFLGVFLADRLCAMAQTAPIFDMNDLSEMRRLDIPVDFIRFSDFELSAADAWEVLDAPEIIDMDAAEPNPEMKLDLDLQPLKLSGSTDNGDISDEEDDPTLATQDKVLAPIYVRDLLSYLSVDTKDTNAYEKRKIALQIAPTLLRQKSAFGTEVSFYAQDLLRQLVGLTNHYDEEQFETIRLNAMIAVVVSYPDIALYLCKLLLTGDYSLQQRLSLLSALSFGARALRGFKDEVVDTSFTPTSFPTQMLPEKLHVQYTSAHDYGYSRIENSIQNQLMNEPAEQARDQIIGAGAKVLRVSAKLTKKAESGEVSKDHLATFRDIAGRVFFFPLVAVWYESGGINIGHYTPVLIAHYIRTLSLILHCAYPAALDLREMAGEYLSLVTPVLQNIGTDQLQVIESIVTGVLLICETLDATYLVTHFDGHLQIIDSILQQWWQSLIDERVKSLCAGLLLTLHRLRESMERTILDQMNGGFYN